MKINQTQNHRVILYCQKQERLLHREGDTVFSAIFFFFLHPLLLFGVFLGQVGKATVRSQTQSSFPTHAHACQELASLLIS